MSKRIDAAARGQVATGTQVSTRPGPLLEVTDLKVHFPGRREGFLGKRRVLRAVDGVSFSIFRGETLGLVGESGSGKSTTGKSVLQIVRPTSGSVLFDGTDLARLRGSELRHARNRMQIIFQDPYASLNPRMTVEEILSEPLVVHRLAANAAARRHRIDELIEAVGLPKSATKRLPHEFSGGQRQRVGIARALAVNPEFIVADEPVSALDVSIQAQIVNLMQSIQDEFGLTYLFVAHDLALVRHICDRVAVMYLGRLVEIADRDELFDRPLHPYTQALISAAPVPDPAVEARRERITLTGEIPSPLNPPSGCRFRTRCHLYKELGGPERCRSEIPELVDAPSPRGRQVACHFAGDS